ncbi:MAG: hypothetical protein JSV49_01130 [Thermoplasmata archaeon]|nr:MAG: hypothetical protein JSV49_01130 [Thermoplasmata archaeon]
MSTVCFAQEKQRHHNPEHHFSFELPEGWEAIPENDLPNRDRELLKDTFEKETVALCQKIGAEYFTTPYILVQFFGNGEINEFELDKLLVSNVGKSIMLKSREEMIQRLQKAEGCLPNPWKGAERINVEVDYDKDRHISFETAKLYHNNVGHIISTSVKLLGSHRMVALQCYADGEDAEGFLDLVDEVVDSFAYDEGYGFGEGEGVAPGLTKKLLGRGIWSWIWPILAISVFFWLLGRWAKS